MSAENHRKQYWAIFGWLTGLTILEVAVVYMPIAKGFIVSSLILLAVGKAALVAIYYMHLGTETPIVRRTVFYCLGIPAMYAAVLVLEAGWRLL